MARITYVKKAQQRYETVPVIDPETGEQKRTPVTGRNGQQKVTKRGKPVFMDVTVADKSKPLPNRKCGKCGKEIEVGQPYKHISPRSGPYGGRTLYRCTSCPNWNVWEYSSSLSARVAEISHDFWTDFNDATFESTDDVQDLLNSAAERVREIAEEKRESAQNIEDGFQHETYQSQELNDVAEQLDSWADEIEAADIPDYPEVEEQDCDDCDGSGEVDNPEYDKLEAEIEQLTGQIQGYVESLTWEHRTLSPLALYYRWMAANKALAWIVQRLVDEEIPTRIECETCDGTGRVEPDEPTEEQIDDWRSEVESAVSIVDECPV